MFVSVPPFGTSENISLPDSLCVFNMLLAGHSSILETMETTRVEYRSQFKTPWKKNS